MTQWPTTRQSLILNLSNEDDQVAWFEFTRLYEPVIYRFARRRGIQHADSVELVQRVLVAVHKSAKDWTGTNKPEKFRSWLATVAANSLLNLVNREFRKRGIGGSSHFKATQKIEDENTNELTIWQEEQQRSLVREAAQRIQNEFSEDSWQAFQRTLMNGESVEKVAKDLSKTPGAVYASRARIVGRLQKEVKRLIGAIQ